MNKFLNILLFNLKVETKFKFDYFIRLIMYFFHIFVFNELWDYLLKDKLILGYDKESLIWYIIIGEMIIFSMSKNYIKISNLVKSGDIANILIKPINILEYLFLMEFTSVITLLLNLFFAISYGILTLGLPNISILNILLFLFSVLLSYIMILSTQVLIGVLAFFFEENEVFYLIISKAILIVTMTPLEFYSGIVKTFMSFLPTTYIVYAPGKIFLNCDTSDSLKLILYQVLSLIFLIGLLIFITKKGVKKINVNGG